MKLFSSFILLLFTITLFSQNWFQNNDYWSYNVSNTLGGGFVGIQDITVDRDTFIAGKSAKVLHSNTISSDGQEYQSELIVFQEDQKNYEIQGQSQFIQLHYDFGLNPGESFYFPRGGKCGDTVTYHLDSLGALVIESDSLTIQHFTVHDPLFTNTFYSRFIERIGSLGFFRIRQNHNKFCLQNFSCSSLCSFNESEEFMTYIESECNQFTSSVIEDSTEIKIYPNPTSHMVYIDSAKKIKTITVMNSNGVNLLEFNYSNKIDIGSLPNGVYFLLISCNSQNSTFRIVKND